MEYKRVIDLYLSRRSGIVRLALVTLFVMTPFRTAVAQGSSPAAMHASGEKTRAIDDARDIDPKKLRKKLKAKEVRWDRALGVLTLTYDFRPGQEKDWEINGRTQPAVALNGVRLPAGGTLAHKAKFTAGTCTWIYSVQNSGDTGTVITAGENIAVETRTRNIGRSFKLNSVEKNIGKIGYGNAGMVPVPLRLEVDGKKSFLSVAGGQVSDDTGAAAGFSFVLHGGNNGGEFGAVVIAGTPDYQWLNDLIE